MNKRLKKAGQAAGRPFSKLRRKQKSTLDEVKVPMITNDTIAEHREDVLSGARKYIYPLQQSKRRIVVLSSIIFILTVVGFFTYSLLNLYRLGSTSTLMYRVTQVVPFPVARVNGKFISYESYLFELRHYMHYYETQQKLSFETEEGQQQLVEFKKQAMEKVIDDAYIKQLADENGVSVNNQEVEQEIAVVRDQNRLGSSDQVFEDVLRDFWGWSVNDFKRSLKQQMLARKVASKLDTEAWDKAESALAELQGGAAFEEVVKKYSEDEATKETGGDYGEPIAQSNRDIPAKVTATVFDQEAGEFSEIIDTGYALEIVKTLGFEGDKAKAAHIQINFKPVSDYSNPVKEDNPPNRYFNP